MKFISTLLRTLAGLMIALPFAGSAQAADPKPASLRVLYVGVDPANTELDKIEQVAGPRFLELRQARPAHFEQFLRRYFSTVKVVYGPAYKESMSNGYDVTIFDTTPPLIKAAVSGKDPQAGYQPAQYLSKEFDRAAILIADVAARIGEGLENKMDWLCLCLDADAHDLVLSHPIFNTPYKVKPTLYAKPMPANYKIYYDGRALPDTLLMWRTQKEGYLDAKGFPPGLVSSGAGYTDAGDAEVISSGVCAKERHSVALARQGNFFHWGFSADPEYMTDEAKLAFVNTVHYISKFNGQHPYSRRPYRAPTRESALDRAYMTRAGSGQSGAGAGAGAGAGNAPVKDLAYYEQNLEYLKPASGRGGGFEVDEDVHSLAVSNRSVGTLDLCVAMLESKVETDKALRILTRYTGEKFQSAAEWRKWLDAHRDKLYFSDLDGFRFHIAP